jgi:putative phosphoesterase
MTAYPVHIGVISDTHGLIRPQALEALADSHLIIHAGDVGGQTVFDALRNIAPTFAVHGNVDTDPWGATLPRSQTVTAGHHDIYVLHRREDLNLDPGAAGFACVIFGHSHQPLAQNINKVLYLNPGAAGPRRFNRPVSVARLVATPDDLSWSFVNLI